MNEMKSSFGCGMKYNDLCNPVNCYEHFVRWPNFRLEMQLKVNWIKDFSFT